MTIATGVNKRVSAAKEVTFGVKAVTAGKSLRRVSSDLALSKDTYESKEIREDYQVADMRHGVRKVEGSIKGELSPAAYADFMAASVRKDFVAGVTATDNDIAATATGFERLTGSFLTEGFKVGDVVRASGFATAANNACNFIVTGVTALALTGRFLIERAITPEAAGANVTIAVVGKKTFAPLTGHTDNSFTIEHFHSDINESEIFKGVKVSGLDISLPPTGMAEITAKLMGQDMEPQTGAHFAAPAPASTSGVLAAVNGLVFAMGKRQTVLTGLSLAVSGNISGDPVVGSNVIPELFNGRIKVSGSMSAYFDTVELRDAFLAESEVALFAVFTSTNAADSDFVAFAMPRIKLGGSSKDDGEKGLIQTVPFTALLGSGANGFEATTISIQDSDA